MPRDWDLLFYSLDSEPMRIEILVELVDIIDIYDTNSMASYKIRIRAKLLLQVLEGISEQFLLYDISLFEYNLNIVIGRFYKHYICDHQTDILCAVFGYQQDGLAQIVILVLFELSPYDLLLDNEGLIFVPQGVNHIVNTQNCHWKQADKGHLEHDEKRKAKVANKVQVKGKSYNTRCQDDKTAKVRLKGGFLTGRLILLFEPWEDYPHQHRTNKDNYTQTRNKKQAVVKIEMIEWKCFKKEDKEKHAQANTNEYPQFLL